MREGVSTLEIVHRVRFGGAPAAGSLTEGAEERRTTGGPDSPSSMAVTAASGILVWRVVPWHSTAASSALLLHSSASITALLWRWQRSSTDFLTLPLYTKTSALVTELISETF